MKPGLAAVIYSQFHTELRFTLLSISSTSTCYFFFLDSPREILRAQIVDDARMRRISSERIPGPTKSWVKYVESQTSYILGKRGCDSQKGGMRYILLFDNEDFECKKFFSLPASCNNVVMMNLCFVLLPFLFILSIASCL